MVVLPVVELPTKVLLLVELLQDLHITPMQFNYLTLLKFQDHSVDWMLLHFMVMVQD